MNAPRVDSVVHLQLWPKIAINYLFSPSIEKKVFNTWGIFSPHGDTFCLIIILSPIPKEIIGHGESQALEDELFLSVL